jgi:Zn-dependent peptidase ImmA (M78 family)/transcriptional regulator with XRE-family HTH domain
MAKANFDLLGISGLETEDLEQGHSDSDVEKIGARIAAARKGRAFSGEQLGIKVGLGKDQISKIESGRRRVGASELPTFARALGVSIAYLLGSPERKNLQIAARLAVTASNDSVRRGRDRARQLLEADDLLTQVGVLSPARVSEQGAEALALVATITNSSRLTADTTQTVGRTSAEAIRKALDLGSTPIRDLPTLIEQHFAADVAISPMGTDVDGFCVHGDHAALILASSDFTDGHLRFTIAHELGHHVFGDPREVIEESVGEMFSNDLVERRASAFAGHLLMPEQGIRSALRWLGEPDRGPASERALVALMEHFSVSLAALAVQMNVLGLISEDESARLRNDVSPHDLIRRHTDVAVTESSEFASRIQRAPERLARNAIKAAQEKRLGLSIVASLLGRADDDSLWHEVMGPEDALTDAPCDDIVL